MNWKKSVSGTWAYTEKKPNIPSFSRIGKNREVQLDQHWEIPFVNGKFVNCEKIGSKAYDQHSKNADFESMDELGKVMS